MDWFIWPEDLKPGEKVVQRKAESTSSSSCSSCCFIDICPEWSGPAMCWCPDVWEVVKEDEE